MTRAQTLQQQSVKGPVARERPSHLPDFWSFAEQANLLRASACRF